MAVDDAGVDVMGDEPIWQGDKVIGWVTSGGYAHNASRSVALGYVPANLAMRDVPVNIEILGDLRPTVILTQPLFDPEGSRMRS